MKQFRLFLSLSLVVFFLVTTGCTEDDIIQRESDRMVGTWFFERVTSTNFLNFQNVTADYRNDEIEFQDDGTVIYIQDNNIAWEGIWAYEIVSTGEGSEGQIVLSLTNTQTNEQTIEIWEDVIINRQVIRAQEDMDGGNLNYKLRRI